MQQSPYEFCISIAVFIVSSRQAFNTCSEVPGNNKVLYIIQIHILITSFAQDGGGNGAIILVFLKKEKKKSPHPHKMQGERATILIKKEKEKTLHTKCRGRGDIAPAVDAS